MKKKILIGILVLITPIITQCITYTTDSSNISTKLVEFKSTINLNSLYNTNKFLCINNDGIKCNSFNTTDYIDIVTEDEILNSYDSKNESYMYNSNSYFCLSNSSTSSNKIYKVSTPMGIKSIEDNEKSSIRPVAYTIGNYTVTGNGTIESPYIIGN